jgi:hypothetical protein
VTRPGYMVCKMLQPLKPWNVKVAALPAVSFFFAIFYGLYLLSYPPTTSSRRKLSIVMLSIPIAVAFRHSDNLLPNYTATDSFARFCYIWLAHMSFEVCVLEFSPVLNARDTWKERVRQGYKVLFDRNHKQVLKANNLRVDEVVEVIALTEEDMVADNKTDGPRLPNHKPMYDHGYTRWQFVRYHTMLACVFYALQCAYKTYGQMFSPLRAYQNDLSGPELGSFFRRLPQSLKYDELYYRTENVFQWNIVTLWLYDGYHSCFAILYVGILQLDRAEEWSLSLFGPLSGAWSVRRY